MTALTRHFTIMAGGTGGHIMPGLAVAARLHEQQHRVSWLGSSNSMEQRLVPEYGFEFHALAMRGLRASGWRRKLGMPWLLSRAVLQAIAVLRRLRPDCVLSMGGFAAAPGGIAAWLLRVPLVVHEQNRIPGLTNRLLARYAAGVCQGFADSFPAQHKALTTGNPLRAEIAAMAAEQPVHVDADQQAPALLQVLVLGGSQGANALNRQLPGILAAAAVAAENKIALCHQCGERWQQVAADAYAAHASAFERVEIVTFIEDMAGAYRRADLVIARAGAMTISELAAAGCASVLVPYPHAVDDHQTANAGVLIDAGAAELLPEDDLAEAAASDLLQRLFDDRRSLQQMARAAAGMRVNDAAGRVADVCLEQCR